MALLDDTHSTRRKPRPSSKANPSSGPSSGTDSATLRTIQSLQRQIADLEAKEEERGNLTKTQAAKLEALETELTALKAAKGSPSQGNASDTEQEIPPSNAGRLAPWCPW